MNYLAEEREENNIQILSPVIVRFILGSLR